MITWLPTIIIIFFANFCIHTTVLSMATTTINDIPAAGYVISRPGNYKLGKNLVYRGRQTAIRINASNVELDFNKYSLQLIRSEAVGINANGGSRVKVFNGSIFLRGELPVTDSTGIHFINTRESYITNFSVRNTYYGIIIQQAQRTTLYDYSFSKSEDNGPHVGLSIRASQRVTVDYCTMIGSVNSADPDAGAIVGIAINTGNASAISQTIAITNCQFPRIDSAIEAVGVTGLLINNCTVIGSSLVSSPLIRIGSAGIGANDVIIHNCTLTKANTAEGYSGIFLENGTGCVLTQNIIDTNASTPITSQRGAAIRIGRRESTDFRNVTIRDCIVQGSNQYGVLVESCAGMVIENTTIKQAQVANILLERTTSSTITESLISEGEADGIVISTDTTANNIINNTISKNATRGIILNAGTTGNLIKNNNIFSNDIGITDLGTNQIFFNNSCNNTHSDCIGIPPNLTGTPGTAAITLGQNICCTA